VHDAVAQFASRDHARRIFQHPFLYLAADTSDVMAATDPRRVENFRWHNSGAHQYATNRRRVPESSSSTARLLSKDHLFEALSFFLVRVPQTRGKRGTDLGSRPSPSSRATTRAACVRNVADAAEARFATSGDIGRKYLINHSAGSGKTLSICWLAGPTPTACTSRHSDKLVDVVFHPDGSQVPRHQHPGGRFERFTHLKDVCGPGAQGRRSPPISERGGSRSSSLPSRNLPGCLSRLRRTQS